MEKNTISTELTISQKEFEALIECPNEVRYLYALKRIADTETMWTIVDDNGAFVIQSYSDERFISLWSSKEYAQAFCIKDGTNYKVKAVTLDTFEDTIIDYICEEELLLNIFPTEQKTLGKVVGLNKFAEDLSHVLEDYIAST